MSEFAVGQRWLSETEPELGLGIVQDMDYRLVTLFFPASDEERTYARQAAPLSRMTYSAGDTLRTADGLTLKVVEVDELDGLLFYQAHPLDQPDMVQPLPESQLNHQVDLSGATDRLFSRQLDNNKWFELRHDALAARAHSESSSVLGLRGPRIDLIPHQLYIAHEVASRYAPRVLLADEVGLGKTIEAGLVIHQQLVSERARRVLVVVPPALVHQWFVEMVRRFNLHFSIFDEDRLQALHDPRLELADPLDEADEEGDPATAEVRAEQPANPFDSEQLVLCSTTFLAQCDMDQLAGADWDLLVVDEAHHLTWSPQGASIEYQRVEQLANLARGVLLLTATPEQLGRESHFARLRLLDPDRYPSLEQFLEEQSHYQEIAELAGHIHDDRGWSEEIKEAAQKHLPDMEIDVEERDTILHELIDRAGTGRVLFRNTRKNIKGFPAREVHPAPLALPDQYRGEQDAESRLYPERAFHDDRWCEQDPRVSWLTDLLRQLRTEKVLVICAWRETASALQAWLNYKQGMSVAMFHEGMDLIERDRAAAFFADPVDGAQALVCSEIGSEGRNFQFAHHLVIFDLPDNPDLLEQRIGRLDRIGQNSTIKLHVPYFEDHAQAVLFHWYHRGMDAFCHTNPAGTAIRERTRDLLDAALARAGQAEALEALVAQTAEVTSELRALLDSGRDRLLELSSFDERTAARLVEQLHDEDGHTPLAFMEHVFERFGVDSEFHSENALVLRPGEQMQMPFPGLPDEGVTVTDHRATALSRDDMQYLTWEHPMVTGILDLLLSDTRGKACVSLLKNPRIKAGTLLLECLYTVDCIAPRALQAHRFLPMQVIRTMMDASGKDISHVIHHEALSKQCHKMEKGLARKVVSSQQDLLEKLLQSDHARAAEQAEPLINDALQRMAETQEQALNRLIQLREKNPAIPQGEIDFLNWQTEQLEQHLRDTRCQLDAVRIIVVSQ
ncbi:MAG: RNA polymerase-associated protein RapA [Alcanivoracaceae bacterium]|nr:RNA polymerase-associated protein RapA [Alcanivoracaceae bacterium]